MKNKENQFRVIIGKNSIDSLVIQNLVCLKNSMYFRRYTRMHLFPAVKYFTKYGVIDKQYQKFSHFLNIQNIQSDTFIKRKLSKAELKEKDLDTKLIDRLFLKYPDLRYEPISSLKFNGRKFNTFSYAYSFISEQKKLIKQGYSIDKAFEIVEQKYQQQMQRKLDQTLLSRGLAIGNRAKSFLTIYQQQVEYESKLKVQRTKRELQKYEDKLNKLRSRLQAEDHAQNENQLESYERIFQKIVKEQNLGKQTKESGKQSIEKRNQMVNNIEKSFKNVFNQFYQRVSTKDKLEGLTDEQIINSIHASPNKIKRQNKLLIEFLKKKGSVTVDHVGQVRVSETENPKLREFLLTSPEVKIALLTEKLNYEKPIGTKGKNIQNLMGRRGAILKNRPDKLTIEEKQLIKYNKKLDMQLVSESDFPNTREAYKIFESNEERLLRLQLKYLDKVCEAQIQEFEKKRAQNDKQGAVRHQKRYEEAEATLSQTIQKFRRIKYRLQNKFRNTAAEQFVFNEHTKLGEDLNGQDVDYQQLLLYLRKKSQERRLTSISQANDNRIHFYLENIELAEYPETQGEVKNKQV